MILRARRSASASGVCLRRLPNCTGITQSGRACSYGRQKEPTSGFICESSRIEGERSWLEQSGSIKGWSKELNDLRAVAKAANASAALFVVTGKKLEAEDVEQAHDLDIHVWDEHQLEYFEAVAEAITDYAKFEIIHSLGIATKEEKDIHRVLAIQIEQPIAGSPVELYMFSTSPERLLRTFTVYRRAAGHAEAYQRMLRGDRLPNIRKFVSDDGSCPVNFSDCVKHERIRPESNVAEGCNSSLHLKSNYY